MDDWVNETAFGKWFLRTDTWRNYVLSPAITELHELGGDLVASASRWLDIGCGYGTSFSALGQTFSPREIIGVDVDPAALIVAKRAASDCVCPVTVLQGSITQLELPDNSVDAVFFPS